MDWSLHLHADKAVKASYAGLDWDSTVRCAGSKIRASGSSLLENAAAAC